MPESRRNDVIRCRALGRDFRGVSALSDLTLDLPKDGLVALIGPNGAGKTTFLNIVSGFLRPTSGTCYFGDQDLTVLRPHHILRRGIARTFQDPRVVRSLSAVENVMVAGAKTASESSVKALIRGGTPSLEKELRSRSEQIIGFVGLEDSGHLFAGELSYGQSKLLSLGCTLATGAGVLLLDEPFSGVHPSLIGTIEQILRDVRSQGKLILFVEHNLDVVRSLAEKVILLGDGRVVLEGPPEEVLNDPHTVRAYVG